MTLQSEYSFLAESIKDTLQAEIDSLDKQIERVKRMAEMALNLSDKVKLRGEVREMQQQRDKKLRNLFKNQDAALAEMFGG